MSLSARQIILLSASERGGEKTLVKTIIDGSWVGEKFQPLDSKKISVRLDASVSALLFSINLI
jgi:hypothetical protein